MSASSSRGKTASSAQEFQWDWDEREMKKRWEMFAKFGAPTATEITGKNFDKWLKDAKILDPKTVSTTITGIAFSKVTGPKKKTLSYPETKEVLVKIAEDRARTTKKSPQEELSELVAKLSVTEGPKLNSTTKAAPTSVVDRLTDTSKYTGSHKERFDAEGKGRGKAGRSDDVPNTGYVASYKNSGTYDKTHGK